MKNKLYLLALIPLALSMTSFNIETQIERSSMELGSEPLADVPENDTDDQQPDQRVDIGQIAGHVEAILREIGELKIDINNNDNKREDTRLEVTSIESKKTEGTSLSTTDNQDTIVLTIRSYTDNNLEAVSGVDCECDAQQLIQLELTPSELGLTADTDIESLDQAKLTEVLRGKSGVIVDKINQQRQNQHETRLAEKDCSSKEDSKEKSNCLLDRVKESSGEEGQEFIAQLRDEMLNLFYSEDRADQRAFNDILKKLTGNKRLRDLRAELNEHKDIKEKIDDYKEESQRFADDVREFNLMYEDNLDIITDIERNGFRSPQDWQNYQTALGHMQYANRMLLGAQSELNTMKRDFRSEFDRITRRSRLSTQHIQIARNYAFPPTARGRRVNVRGRTSGLSPLAARPLIGNHHTNILGDDYSYYNLQRPSLHHNRHNGFNFTDRSRGTVGQRTFNRGTRGRRSLLRYDGPHTLSRANPLNIHTHRPIRNTYQPSRGRGRNIIGRGRNGI